MESVQSFAKGAAQADDITVAIVRHSRGARAVVE
jgi:hypothetical protein